MEKIFPIKLQFKIMIVSRIYALHYNINIKKYEIYLAILKYFKHKFLQISNFSGLKIGIIQLCNCTRFKLAIALHFHTDIKSLFNLEFAINIANFVLMEVFDITSQIFLL